MEHDSKRIVAEWNREIAAEDHRLAAARQALPCLRAIYGFRAASSPRSLSKDSISLGPGRWIAFDDRWAMGGVGSGRLPRSCAILSFR